MVQLDTFTRTTAVATFRSLDDEIVELGLNYSTAYHLQGDFPRHGTRDLLVNGLAVLNTRDYSPVNRELAAS